MRSTALALLLVLCAVTLPARAAPTANRFEPTMQVQGTTLHINGSGTRYKTVFRVYDLALYTTKKVGTPEDLLALPGPKRMQFIALRELSTTDIGRLFFKGINDNSPKETVQKHAVSTTQFIEVFSSRSRLMPGDTFAIEFVPGKGMQFYHQNKPQGGLIGDDEFSKMVMRIWVGPVPADAFLKDALLGIER